MGGMDSVGAWICRGVGGVRSVDSENFSVGQKNRLGLKFGVISVSSEGS